MRTTILAIMMAAAVTPAAAAIQLVQNGGFEDTTPNGDYGQVGYNTDVDGWSVTGGYTFLFNTTNVDTTGSNGQFGSLSLWGVGNGGPDTIVASPDGGNFVAIDSAFQQAPLTQTISGLTAGKEYVVSFYWAVAQQYGFNGPTYDNLEVSLGGETHSTATATNPEHAFNGWWKESFTYTATSPTETLSFFAAGGPPGVPPFALLDGVSVTASIPEASTWSMLVVGFAGLGYAGFRAHRKARAVV